MPRPLRPPVANATYHVTARGNRGAEIVRDDADRSFWVGLLENVVAACAVTCHMYCLMTNHFHLLLTTPEANVSAAMQSLNGEHAQWFNWRYGLKGHLFQGRFWSEPVDDDAYFAEVTRYIALNPVRAGLVTRAQDWRWSGFATAVGGDAPRQNFLTTGRVLAQFSDDVPEAQRVFSEFVEAAA
jgi:REP-associated tyrosine transposase